MRSSAMSVCLSVPTIRAGILPVTPGIVTVTFSAFSTTCWLVRMRPSALAITPEPVTSLRRSFTFTIASTCTTDGVTRFEISMTRSWSCASAASVAGAARRRRAGEAASASQTRLQARAERRLHRCAPSSAARSALRGGARDRRAEHGAGHRDARGAGADQRGCVRRLDAALGEQRQRARRSAASAARPSGARSRGFESGAKIGARCA